MQQYHEPSRARPRRPTTADQRSRGPRARSFERSHWEWAFREAQRGGRAFSCALLVVRPGSGDDETDPERHRVATLVEIERSLDHLEAPHELLFGVEGDRAYLALLGSDLATLGNFAAKVVRRAHRCLAADFPAWRPEVSVGVASNLAPDAEGVEGLFLETLLTVAAEGADVAEAHGGRTWVHTELYGLAQRGLETRGFEAPSAAPKKARRAVLRDLVRPIDRAGSDAGVRSEPLRASEPPVDEHDRAESREARGEAAADSALGALAPEARDLAKPLRSPGLGSPGDGGSESASGATVPSREGESVPTPVRGRPPESAAPETPAARTAPAKGNGPLRRSLETPPRDDSQAADEDGWREILPAPKRAGAHGVPALDLPVREEGLGGMVFSALKRAGLSPTEASAAEGTLLPLLASYVDAQRQRTAEEGRARVQLLERRVQKLRRRLEELEQVGPGVAAGPELDGGLSSTFREVQGLSRADGQFELKSQLLEAILQANLELAACTAHAR